MFSLRTLIIGCGIFGILAFGSVSAQLVYVDASDGFASPQNIFPSDNSLSLIPGALLDPVEASVSDDNLWSWREFAAGASIYTSSDAAGEDAPEIFQSLTGLAAGTTIDVYAVYWSARTGTNDWAIRAGLSSAPGANQIYDASGGATLAGETTATIAGTPGGLVAWSVLPADNTTATSPANLDTNGNFLQDPAGVFVEGNRQLFVANVGTATVDGTGTVNVYIDDLSNGTLTVNGTRRSWFDGLASVAAGTDVAVRAMVDRATGAVSIVNNTGATFDVSGYSVSSAVGGLNDAAWLSIAGGSNSGITESADWMVDSQSGTALTESEIATPATTGAVLGSAGLPLGNVWRPSSFEDLSIELTVIDGSFGEPFTYSLTPEYTGNEFVLGDFDGMNGLDIADYQILINNLHSEITPTTQLDGYFLGDMTIDGVINFDDYDAFRNAYIAANGAQAFAALVPEPSPILLFGFGCLPLIWLRKRCRAVRSSILPAMLAALVGLFMCDASQALAQVTYVDADVPTTTVGNTNVFDTAMFPAIGDWVDLSGANNNASTVDNLWLTRSPFGNGGQVFTANDRATAVQNEDVPTIVTTITSGDGLVAGQAYDIFGYFWSNLDAWSLRASISGTPGAANLFNPTEAPAASTQTFSNSPLITEGDRTLYVAELGTAVADSSGNIPVFIDDLPNSTTSTNRTWFDGVGFELSTIELLTLEVNTSTGVTTLKNDSNADFDLRYYEIQSPSGALDVNNWATLDSLEGNDPVGIGWDVAGGSDQFILSEARLQGSTTYASGASQGLGSAFTVGGSEDLQFFYAEDGDTLKQGLVQYVSSGLACDLDGDGDCDPADIDLLYNGSPSSSDISTWLSQASDPANPFLQGTRTFVIGDVNLDGNVDSGDLGLLLNNFNSTAALNWGDGNLDADGVVASSDLGQLLNNFGHQSPAAAAAVPEPDSTTLLLVFGLILTVYTDRRRK